MSKWLSSIDIRVQGQQLLTWQSGISQYSIHGMSTGSICEKIPCYFFLLVLPILIITYSVLDMYPHCRHCSDDPLYSVLSWLLPAALAPAVVAAAVAAVGEQSSSS